MRNSFVYFLCIPLLLFVFYVFQCFHILRADSYFGKQQYDMAFYHSDKQNQDVFFFLSNDFFHCLDQYSIFIAIEDSVSAEKTEVFLRENLDTMNEEAREIFYFLAGNRYVSEANLQKAIDNYKNCLRINPDNTHAKINLAWVLSLEKDKSESGNKEKTEYSESSDDYVMEKIITNYETNGFENYKKFLNNKFKSSNENYW